MEARPLRLVLALGLFLGLTACQDDRVVAPDDVGPLFAVDLCEKNPNHPKCVDPPSDPDGDPTATVELAGGMVAFMTEVSVTRDSRHMLELWNGPDNAVDVEMNFSIASPGSLDACWTSPEGAGVAPELAELLELDVPAGWSVYFNMDIYKKKLGQPSDKHLLHIRYTHPNFGMIIIGFYGAGGPTVRLVPGTEDVYEFSGIVQVWDKNESANEGVILSCPTDDKVTVTITDYTP